MTRETGARVRRCQETHTPIQLICSLNVKGCELQLTNFKKRQLKIAMLTLTLVSDADWVLQCREEGLQRGGAVCLRPSF